MKRYRPIYYPTTRFSDRLKTNFLTFEDSKSHFKLNLSNSNKVMIMIVL